MVIKVNYVIKQEKELVVSEGLWEFSIQTEAGRINSPLPLCVCHCSRAPTPKRHKDIIYPPTYGLGGDPTQVHYEFFVCELLTM